MIFRRNFQTDDELGQCMFHGNDGIRFDDRHLVCALSPHVVDRGPRIDGDGDFGTVRDGLVVRVIRPYRRLVRKKIDRFWAAGSSPPVLFPSRMSSLPPHEDSRLAATTAERKKIVFMLKNN